MARNTKEHTHNIEGGCEEVWTYLELFPLRFGAQALWFAPGLGSLDGIVVQYGNGLCII
jgi:hypothetical protein